jgi:hypothetical protein
MYERLNSIPKFVPHPKNLPRNGWGIVQNTRAVYCKRKFVGYLTGMKVDSAGRTVLAYRQPDDNLLVRGEQSQLPTGGAPGEWV